MQIHSKLSHRLRFSALLFLTLVPLFLMGCAESTESNRSVPTESSKKFSVAVPEALQKLRPDGELTAQLIVAGVRIDLRMEDNKVSGTIAKILVGKQSFVIEYFLDGVLITRATTEANVVEDSTIVLSFPPEALTFSGGHWNEMNWNTSPWS